MHEKHIFFWKNKQTYLLSEKIIHLPTYPIYNIWGGPLQEINNFLGLVLVFW